MCRYRNPLRQQHAALEVAVRVFIHPTWVLEFQKKSCQFLVCLGGGRFFYIAFSDDSQFFFHIIFNI